MTETHKGLFAGTLETLGRFFYKLMLAIAIVWVLGLIVSSVRGLVAGGPPPDSGGGPAPVSSSR